MGCSSRLSMGLINAATIGVVYSRKLVQMGIEAIWSPRVSLPVLSGSPVFQRDDADARHEPVVIGQALEGSR